MWRLMANEFTPYFDKKKQKTKTKQQQMYSIKRHVIMFVNTKYARIINQTSILISKFFILPSKNILSLSEPCSGSSVML